MEGVFATINRLQEVISISGSGEIQLPQIVVVGSQSCGKSSVLESLVGKDFLPRGTGIVTRCPIVLQMIHVSDEDTDPNNGTRKRLGVEEWCEFTRTKKTFTNFDEVRREIEEETVRKAGTNKGICVDSICLKIYSPNVVNLSLIDLPGIVKVALDGQPKDIEAQVENMVMHYIKNENCIILAVSPAADDFAVSESMKLARKVDPDGRRTIAVLSKLDVMDRGASAIDILSGKSLPVKLGIIGVVNRGQEDLAKGMDVPSALKKEAKFLARHYPTMCTTNGTPYLRKRLSEILHKHIVTCLPPLIARVNGLLFKTEKELESLGTPIVDKSKIMANILVKFGDAYKVSISGNPKNIETKQLAGGARINYIFSEVFPVEIAQIDPLSELTDIEILIAGRNARGVESRYIVFEEVYHHLVKLQVRRLEAPVVHCAQLVDVEMKQIIQNCMKRLETDMLRFPKLKARIEHVMIDMLNECQKKAQEIVKLFVDIKASFVATVSNDFKALEQKTMDTLKIPEIAGHMVNLPNDIDPTASYELTDQQKTFCDVTKETLKSYFNIITASVIDFVPKALVQSVVYYTEENVTETLLQLYKEDWQQLIAESDEMAQKRQIINEKHVALVNAKEILSEHL